MDRLAILLLLLPLSAWAQPLQTAPDNRRPRQPSAHAADQAMQRMVDCFGDQIRALDDRRSDASKIALAVRSGCEEEVSASIRASFWNVSTSQQTEAKRQMEPKFLQRIIRLVLEHRRF